MLGAWCSNSLVIQGVNALVPGQGVGFIAHAVQAVLPRHAAHTGVVLKDFCGCRLLYRQHVVGVFAAFVFEAIHAGFSNGHSRHRKSQGKGSFLEQAVGIGCRHVAFDGVATDAAGVAGAELLRHA